ncbi:MAG: Fe-S cluster assembly protein SufD [Actinomycetota bacterium]|nr:Fe-S cluster assembly protein SufD [Actinomycetota bacterium]
MPLPSPEEEDWRYSRIGELQLDRYHPLDAPTEGSEPPPTDIASYGDPTATLLLRNGWVDSAWVDPDAANAGVTVGPAGDLEAGERLLQSDPTELFDHLNLAFSPQPSAVVVPDGVRLKSPIVVLVHTDTDGAAVFPRLVVEVGRDASATLVEIHTSADVESLVVPVLDVSLGPAARFHHGVVQNIGKRVWQIGTQAFRVETGASLEAFTAALGGDYARTRIDCRLVGRGAEGRLTAAYFGEGTQTLDFRTFQEHAAPDTISNLLFKGALDDASRSVYSGLIRVQPEAIRTRAHQTNRNVKLSAEAWAESVPNLEIETNDVICSHASAVSPVDEEQRFYLESRGVPTPIAERLIVEGFFNEVVAAAPMPQLGEILRLSLAERLDRRVDHEVAA